MGGAEFPLKHITAGSPVSELRWTAGGGPHERVRSLAVITAISCASAVGKCRDKRGAGLRLPRRHHAHAWIQADVRGSDGGVALPRASGRQYARPSTGEAHPLPVLRTAGYVWP